MSRVPLIALFGPDGSGKSTVAGLLESRLIARGITVSRYHWRPRVLPSLKKDYSTPAFHDPNGLQPRGYAVSFVCYLYFFLDFWVAQWTMTSNSEGDDHIVLYERYFSDVLFHPRRYKLKQIDWLGLFLSKCLRRPTISFLLVGAPEMIHKRKPELPVDEIDRQVNTMSEKLPGLSETVVIDTERLDAASVCDEIVRIIAGRLYKVS